MIERIKKYLEYRRNKKLAKMELAKIAAVTLPVVMKVSGVFQVDNGRIIEVLTYMAKLQPEDIQRIIIHSVGETMAAEDK